MSGNLLAKGSQSSQALNLQECGTISPELEQLLHSPSSPIDAPRSSREQSL
jgi:hypothetical protein